MGGSNTLLQSPKSQFCVAERLQTTFTSPLAQSSRDAAPSVEFKPSLKVQQESKQTRNTAIFPTSLPGLLQTLSNLSQGLAGNSRAVVKPRPTSDGLSGSHIYGVFGTESGQCDRRKKQFQSISICSAVRNSWNMKDKKKNTGKIAKDLQTLRYTRTKCPPSAANINYLNSQS